MKRRELESLAKHALYSRVPDLTGYVASEIVNSPPFQRWMDSFERKRPRWGLVALFRRLRGKERGITAEQRAELERLVEQAAKRR